MTSPGAPPWLPSGWSSQTVDAGLGLSLAETCAPALWAGDRWPDMAWRDGCLIRIVATRSGPVVAVAWQASPDRLTIAGPRDDPAQAILPAIGADRAAPASDDPVIAGLAARFPGLHPFGYGSVYLGLLTSIVGQSISVASAAATQTRLAALFGEPVTLAGRAFRPLPDPAALASATVERIRSSGVTWRRAEALAAIARLAADQALPSDWPDWAGFDADGRIAALRELPLVGPWTARSALLWGVADDTVWPDGDVALLRAARLAYGDGALDMAGLRRLAAGWGSAPGRATRLLWAGLFGVPSATM